MNIHPRKHARTMVQQLIFHADQCVPSCNLCFAQETDRLHASSWLSRSCVVTQTSSDHPHLCWPYPVCLLFALPCFNKSTLGNCYGSGFLRERAKGHEPTIENHQRNSSKSPCPPLDNQSGGGSLPSTLTTSLAIPIPSSSSSNGPSH